MNCVVFVASIRARRPPASHVEALSVPGCMGDTPRSIVMHVSHLQGATPGVLCPLVSRFPSRAGGFEKLLVWRDVVQTLSHVVDETLHRSEHA